MFRAIVLFLATIGTSAAAENVTSFSLDNGMDVVVIEDHRAPVVVHMVYYKVGAADEPPGQSGIAHFLEHLMFKGTDDLEAGEFSRIVELNGGSDNAFTSRDQTAYYQRIAADRLGLVMEMEADRMRDLRLSLEDVLTERDVILEERAQRTDSDPGSLFSEQRTAAQFMNHPYGIPVIGWRAEMEQLTLEDALAFYRTYYAPNNAILIVAGDVYPDDVHALAEEHYGPLAPTPGLTERRRPQEPPHLAERRLVMEDARVGQPYVIRSYLAPERNAGDQETAAALVLLAELLGGSPATSAFARKLQFETQVAVSSGAFYTDMAYDPSTFGIYIVPAQGVSLEQAEAALDQALAEFMAEGVDIDALERLKMQARAALIYETDNVQSVARRYGRALTSGLTIEDIQNWPDIVQSVTPEEIMEAAQLVFDRNNAVTGWLTHPEGDAQ